MRPLELLLENFGAYREATRVDFTRLGPLFLVWGKTGSGKTTLFDAMAYALYGEAPGSRRALSLELRSQYAKAGDEPRVEFTFALGTRLWRAKRTPPWTRPGRGGKLVEAGQGATLETRKGEVWSVEAEGPRAVDERIKALLGLTAEEFSKIILLPQGEFQRFLEMGSTERVAILEKLFPVDLHDRITVLAVEKAKAALAEGKNLDSQVARIVGEGGGPEGEKALELLSGEVERLEAAARGAVEARIAASGRLQRGREDQARREAQAAALERLRRAEAGAGLLEMTRTRLEAARRAEKLLPRLDESERLAEAARRGEEELKSRTETLEAIEARRPMTVEDQARVIALASEIEVLDQELGKLARAAEAWNRIALAKAALETARVEATKAEAALLETGARSDAARRGLEEARAELAKEEEVRSAFVEANAAFEKAKAVEKAAERLEEATRACAVSETAFERSAAAVGPLDAELAEAERRREKGLAAELAAGLKPGEPCPVCGSLEHPLPAQGEARRAEGLTLEAIRKKRETLLAAVASAETHRDRDAMARTEAKEALDVLMEGEEAPDSASAREARTKAQNVVAEAGRRQAELVESKRRAEVLAKAFDETAADEGRAEALLAEARTRREVRETELKGFAEAAGRDDPRPRAAELTTKRLALEEGRLSAGKRVAAWERERESAFALLEAAKERQPGLEKAAAEGRKRAREAMTEAGIDAETEARAAALPPQDIARLDRELREGETELAGAKAAAETATAALGAGEPPDIGALEAEAKRAEQTQETLQEELREAQAGKQRLSTLIAERRRLEEARRVLDASSGRLAALADLLAGNIAPRRLPFKYFVLGAYFKTVVDRASLRLAELSDGRYTLLADEGQGRGRVGLDIQVRDAYTGRLRPSGTLSGGERFLSSLALALGLADTIRSRSGGVSLDAVFIDEGFGSLDEETLDRAIAALDRARGDRMIGIVSHVVELRNRIPSRIEVRKGRAGSSLEIVG